MTQLLADRAFERDALDFFVTPLADILDEAAAESSARAQRDKVVETFRVAVRMLSMLALAGSSGPPALAGQLADLLKKLLRQGLTDGEWVGLTREIPPGSLKHVSASWRQEGHSKSDLRCGCDISPPGEVG